MQITTLAAHIGINLKILLFYSNYLAFYTTWPKVDGRLNFTPMSEDSLDSSHKIAVTKWYGMVLYGLQFLFTGTEGADPVVHKSKSIKN